MPSKLFHIKTIPMKVEKKTYLQQSHINIFIMLRWAVIFLIIAIIAGIFGFTGISTAAASIAKIIFYIFIALFVLGLILGYTIFKKK